MGTNYRHAASRTAIAAVLLVIFASSAEAALFGRGAVRAEPSDPAATQFHLAAQSIAPEEILPASVPLRTCIQPACISYKMHKQGRKICCDCPPPMKTVLCVENARDCCCYAIPVCIPGCCDGPPSVDCRRALFGRAITTIRWCCGFEIRVVFRARGDVVVNYYGSLH